MCGAKQVFDSGPVGKGGKAWPKKDLWHLRSLLFTEPVDFMVGNTCGKYLERDCNVPLVGMGLPIFEPVRLLALQSARTSQAVRTR